jgi:hypothetical protein
MRIPTDSTLTGQDSCGLHITGKYGILLGSFSKIVTIVLENLLYFFVGKCITEDMGNRGVIHKAGSF